MDQRSKIPALALLGLSFTQCTGREQAANPIVGDWRAIQVDGEKHPVMGGYNGDTRVGEQIRIADDLEGEMSRYEAAQYDGLDYLSETIAALVVDDSAAPKYRIDVAADLFDVYDYSDPVDSYGSPDSEGYADSGYADAGGPDSGYGDSGSDPADEASPPADRPVKPLTVPTTPDLAPGAVVFDCTLDGDTLTCDREGATELKHWIFTRIEAEET